MFVINLLYAGNEGVPIDTYFSMPYPGIPDIKNWKQRCLTRKEAVKQARKFIRAARKYGYRIHPEWVCCEVLDRLHGGKRFVVTV